MLEFEDKAHHRLPLSLPKAKDYGLDNVEDDEEENATENSDEDSEDSASEADIPYAL